MNNPSDETIDSLEPLVPAEAVEAVRQPETKKPLPGKSQHRAAMILLLAMSILTVVFSSLFALPQPAQIATYALLVLAAAYFMVTPMIVMINKRPE